MKTLTINKPVSVTKMSFGRNLRAYPQAIAFDGERYEFADRGFSYCVKRGGVMTNILSLTSDTKQFWLRDDGGGTWTLLGVSV